MAHKRSLLVLAGLLAVAPVFAGPNQEGAAAVPDERLTISWMG